MSKKYIIIIVNVILAAAIIFLAYGKLFKVNVTFDCGYGSSTAALDELAIMLPDNSKSPFKAVFLFNKLPNPSTMETIEKLYHIYREELSVSVFFSKPFKSIREIVYPHKMLPRYRFSCKKDEVGEVKQNYFILIKDGKLIYVDNRLDFFSFNLVILKNLKGGTGEIYSKISKDDLRARLVSALNRGKLNLHSITDDRVVDFSRAGAFSEIYFFHADCSACELKKVLNEVKIKKIMDNMEVALVFSVFANPHDVRGLLADNGIDIPAYVDRGDVLQLAARVSDNKDNPVILKNNEWRNTE